jgi:hypothetical protein
MKLTQSTIGSICLIALIVSLGTAGGAKAQDNGFFAGPADGEKTEARHTALTCKGKVGLVLDAGDETLHTTTAVFGTSPGGGEGGQFDPVPVLTIRGVTLDDDECLNAHLSVLMGSAQTYGGAALALFQVTLTPSGTAAPPRHMVGHYPTPYGFNSPAVALEAETDVDMFAANFFQAVGPDSEHGVPPGVYDVNVWWAGAPPFGPGGNLAAAFVLKLYLRD